MAVDSFDPTLMQSGLTPEVVAQFVDAAQNLEAAHYGLDELSIKRLGPLARSDAGDWRAAVADLETGQVVQLVKLFTLAEQQLTGWDSGAKSPVVVLVRELKARGAYPDDLTGWIKANTDNRFLPHGSLMDRL